MILRLLALLLVAVPAHAQEKAEPAPSTVALRAQADREVANDLVVATVAAEETGTDTAALAAAVKSRSGGYQTFPVYKGGRIESWRVSQQLRLESADFPAMAARAPSAAAPVELEAGVSLVTVTVSGTIELR